MRKFYYNTEHGKRWITLRHPNSEWVNRDCIPIYYIDDSPILRHPSLGSWTFMGYEKIAKILGVEEAQGLPTLAEIRKFIEESDKAFERRFPDIDTSTSLLDNFDKSEAIKEYRDLYL